MTDTAKSNAKRSTASYAAAWATATSADQDIQKRVMAFAGVARGICDDQEKLEGVIKVLKDTQSPQVVRLAALSALQSASFSAIKFTSCRPIYLTALRSLIDDPDPELRQRVLGILSREQDSYTQQRLLEGLQQPDKALVPPEKALQLLSNDIHADAYPVAREIVRQPPNPEAKREALRLLAADAASAPAFEEILRNKQEPLEIRQLSASALHSLAPQKLQACARDIVLDDSESDELKTTSLTALTHFGDQKTVTQDDALQEAVNSFKDRAGTSGLKGLAQDFLKKYHE